MMMHQGKVEHVTWNSQHIATIIRSDFMPEETTFVTPESYYQQSGFVAYKGGTECPRHCHLPLQRYLVGTSEAIMVRKGRVEVDLYALDKRLIGTWTLGELDLILLVAGGHGFRFLEDSLLLEIKQGPYTGLIEKETF